MSFDKGIADLIVRNLSGAKEILEQGRSFGVRIVATEDAVKSLSQSNHPDKDLVLSLICVEG